MDERRFQDWVVVYKTGMDYDADLVRDRLDDSGIPAVVLTQRDHAFNLNVGDLAAVNVLVPPERVDEAVRLLESEPLSDHELENAALSADPSSPPAHDEETESMLDSGFEQIRLTPPDEEEDEPT